MPGPAPEPRHTISKKEWEAFTARKEEEKSRAQKAAAEDRAARIKAGTAQLTAARPGPMDGRGHKHKNSGTSFLSEGTLSSDATPSRAASPGLELQQDALITAPTFQSPTRHSMSRKRSGSLLNASELSATSQSVQYSELSGSAATSATTFRVRGRRVKVSLTKFGLCWQYEGVRCLGMPCQGASDPTTVPYTEILSVEAIEPAGSCGGPPACRINCCVGACCPTSFHQLAVTTLARSASKPCIWRHKAVVFQTANGDDAARWATMLKDQLRRQTDRPRTLLVFLNPFGGAKRAQHVWDNIISPVMKLVGVACTVLSTERLNHARQVLEALPAEELARFDGVIAVGGDGLFQEALNGLLTLRAEGGERAAVAAKVRLGHIPAGSTDAVAYSLNGTRGQETAALHIALGDRTSMDVMRVDAADGERRFCCCVASYGYMGDLMKESERMRWLGPSRYNLAGALTLFKNKAYRAKIQYLPSATQSYTARRVCNAQCEWCRTAGAACPAHTDVFSAPSMPDTSSGGWKTVEGEFSAIMAVVMPCRSDRSNSGLAPFAHMADGIIHLILVKKCSAPQYLRFLASIPQNGVIPEDFPYVDAFDATAVRIDPEGAESVWSVDGELLGNNHIYAKVYRGLVEVFGRGVEL